MPSTCRVFRWRRSAQEAIAKRRIGLGVTGLADALIFCRARYGSQQSIALIESWLKTISHAAYRASVALAKEKGAFPLFDRDAYLARPHIRRCPPTFGTASPSMASAMPCSPPSRRPARFPCSPDNVSSGIEPVFALRYTRKVLQPDGSKSEETVEDYALRKFRARFGDDAALPDYFVTPRTSRRTIISRCRPPRSPLSTAPFPRPSMCPPTISFEDFAHVYRQAYETAAKAAPPIVPTTVTGSVLSRAQEPNDAVPPKPSPPERRAGTAAALARTARAARAMWST